MKKDVLISVRIPKVLKTFLKKQAKREKLKLSELIIRNLCEGSGVVLVPTTYKFPKDK